MSMLVNSLYNSYVESSVNASGKKQRAENGQTQRTDRSGAPLLSAKAQDYLDQLNQSYGNMEFLVCNSGEDAKEALSRSTKEVSVILTRDELERMASDEKYAAEKMKGVRGALRMSEQINREFGFVSAFGENADTQITKIAISFNEDGTTSIFAELEKSGRKQRERIEGAKEEKRQQRKAEEKRAQKEKQELRFGKEAADRYFQTGTDTKHTIVEAGSVEELLQKIAAVDWNKIRSESRLESGGRFDSSI